MVREKLQSRLGFLMLAAGCAVGLGNVWRFPYIVGKNGGAAFVLVYLLFLALLGFPLLMAELTVGRGARMGISKAMRQLAPEGSRGFWGGMGRVIFAGNFLLMLYYSDVAGWLLKYFSDYLRPSAMPTAEGAEAGFAALLGSAPLGIAFMALAVAVTTALCLGGVRKSVERATKWMMISLLALIGILAVKALSLPNAMKGVAFYLAPDWATFSAHPFRAIFEAMGQAFFTLSTGVGCMTIFGSYTDRAHTMVTETIWIIVIDTCVALLAGIIIFPACASFGVDVSAGPGLIFIALPKVFANMAGGRIWGAVFFLFLSLAALTTMVAVFECLIGGLMDEFGWSRVRASLTVGVAVLLFSLPCVLGFNLWKDLHPFGGTKTILDCEDYLFSQFWLPLGALASCIYAVRPVGWGWSAFREEASAGAGLRLPAWFRPYMRYLLPLILLTVLLFSLRGE
ncbi:MAG: sodium-dependent transporter, partial [Kiritimatiellae bacterium]|nr:sodium-dependent transporter [Kiritimatiellia bacterium]